MSSTTVESFTRSLAQLDVPVTRTPAAEAETELAALIEGPAVGTPIDIDGVSLPEDVVTDPAPSELDGAVTGVTPTGPAIADYGTVTLPADDDLVEHVSLFADTHVAVVPESRVVPSMRAGIDELGPATRDGLTSVVLATGPSATADMGSTVIGVHGPTDVHVLLITDR